MGSQRVVSKLGEMGAHQDMLNPREMKRAGGDTIQWDNKEMKQKEQLIANFMALGLDGMLFTAGKSGKIPYGRIKKYFRDGGTLPGGGNDDQNKPGKLETLQFFYHPDHLGSSSFITDVSGEVYQHVQYFPFGETFVEERTGTRYTPYLYNGKELDEETGLYYYHARYYDPRISMFYGVDPLAEKYIGISSYAYVANNPMILVDPDGRDIYHINADAIEVTKTDDTFDRYYLKSIGLDGESDFTTFVGQFDKNENGLIQLPSEFSFTNRDFGTSFAFSVKEGNESRSFIRGDAFAALIGALAITNTQDLVILGFSNSDGSSPKPSVSHRQGINGDFRYLRTDHSGERVLLNQPEFDFQRQNTFNNALYRFGWTDLISERFTPAGQTESILLNHSRHYSVSRHHNHLHIQGFRPNLIIK